MRTVLAFLVQASQPASAQQAQSASLPLPWWLQYIVIPVVLLAIGAILGSWIKYLFDRRLPSQQIKQGALKCSATYCQDLLSPTVNDVKDDLEIRLHGQQLLNPVVINYRIESTGNTAITDVNMRVEAADADRIIRWNFYVDQAVQCDRMVTIEETDRLLRFKWTYLNPGDAMTLVLLVAPCKDAKCITLQIDAKDVSVKYEGMREDCSVLT